MHIPSLCKYLRTCAWFRALVKYTWTVVIKLVFKTFLTVSVGKLVAVITVDIHANIHFRMSENFQNYTKIQTAIQNGGLWIRIAIYPKVII